MSTLTTILSLIKHTDADTVRGGETTDSSANMDKIDAVLAGTDAYKIPTAALAAGAVTSDKANLTTAYAAAVSDDTTQTANDWNSVGLAITLTPGTWIVWAGLSFLAVGAAGNRYGRIRNTTTNADIAAGGGHGASGEGSTISLCPQLVTVAVNNSVEVHFYALNVGDRVYGDVETHGAPGSSIMALRVA